jgi:uncharacterized protein HemY
VLAEHGLGHVLPQDPEAAATALATALADRQNAAARAVAARAYAQEHFSARAVACAYTTVYAGVSPNAG